MCDECWAIQARLDNAEQENFHLKAIVAAVEDWVKMRRRWFGEPHDARAKRAEEDPKLNKIIYAHKEYEKRNG